MTRNASLEQRLKAYQVWGDVWVRAGWRVQRNVVTGACRVLDPNRSVRLTESRDDCAEFAARMAPGWNGTRGVVLLPALATTPRLLTPLAKRLTAKGYATATIAYPSLNEDMSGHVRRVRGIVAQMARDGIEEISFVGHSIGGLVARAVSPDLPMDLKRIVFLGTSNHGSRLGQILNHLPLYATVFGPSGQDVLPARATRLPIPDVPMLVIAGGTGWFGFNPLLPGDDDGIVTVAETRIDAPHAFLRVPYWHRFLPRHPRAQAAVIDFIRTGKTP